MTASSFCCYRIFICPAYARKGERGPDQTVQERNRRTWPIRIEASRPGSIALARREVRRRPLEPGRGRPVPGAGADRSTGPDLSSLTHTYAIPGAAILPLRLFLGITFVYAGIQKLNDPGFFTLGSRTYIGTQMLQFSKGSPINFLFQPLLAHATIIGGMTIVTEICIGLLVLVGLFTRLAALGGLLLNLVFFLSASWNVYPYFLGADIVFVVAWLTLAITGPGGFCLESLVERPVAARVSCPIQRLLQGPTRDVPDGASMLDPTEPSGGAVGQVGPAFSRREALAGGLAALGLFILGVIPRSRAAGSSAVAAAPSNPAATPPPASSGSSSSPPAGYQKVGTISQIPANSGLAVTDPKSGDPAVVVHSSGSDYYAFDAVCTHAGCTVQYDPSYKLLVCPCHGGAFDPAHGATVVAGPPPAPLTALPIHIDAAGNVYLA
jgi:thiosulfate dehydrogenase [quinone] large subunit